MMENLILQQLINQIQEGLIQAGASKYYQNVFKTLTKQLLLYAEKHNKDSFSMDFGYSFWKIIIPCHLKSNRKNGVQPIPVV